MELLENRVQSAVNQFFKYFREFGRMDIGLSN